MTDHAIVSRELQTVDIYGQSFQVSKEPSDFWPWLGETGKIKNWSKDFFQFFDKVCTPQREVVFAGTNFIDLGSWIGPMTLYGSRFANHVWSIEPDPIARQILEINCEANDLKNVTIVPGAVMGHNGTTSMGGQMLGCSCTRQSNRENSVSVECVTLSALQALYNIQDPIFMKIDTEGAERHIFRDFDFFEKHRPNFHLSTHKGWWEEAGVDFDQAMEPIRKVLALYSNVTEHCGDYFVTR